MEKLQLNELIVEKLKTIFNILQYTPPQIKNVKLTLKTKTQKWFVILVCTLNKTAKLVSCLLY